MAAGITLAKAKEVFQRYVGCISDEEILLDGIISGLEFTLLNGGGEILREWDVLARDGKFTFPRTLETPLKYKFSERANASFGIIHSPYFSYGSSSIQNCCGFLDWTPQFEVKANKVGTQFDPPKCGVRLVATTRNNDDAGKKIMVCGEWKGKEIAATHNRWNTAGEFLTIYHIDDPSKKYSAFPFDKITSITKDKTIDWIMLSGADLQLNKAYFLSHYHPDDETVQFIQGQMFNGCGYCGPTNCDVLIKVLGRVNPSIRYSRDEDILPISSIEMLSYLGKRFKYEESGDLKEVAGYEQRIRNLIKQQVGYQQKTGNAMSFDLKASGSTMTNV